MPGKKTQRVLQAIQNMGWAITPEMLETIYQIVLDHGAGAQISLEALEGIGEIYVNRADESSRIWIKLEGTKGTLISNGVAVVPVIGVLSKRMGLFADISGGTSMQTIQKDIDTALKSELVNSILLDVDSPGGTVDGTKALADFIMASRGKKPITAFANGQMTSAAYWIGSAADEIVAEETSAVGSIGVISMHYDYSKMDSSLGVKRTVITAGKYKALGNDTEPLTDESRKLIQERLDTYYKIFVDAVAQNRGTTPEKVLADMADGRIFIGRQALDNGMVDEIGSFDFAFNQAKASARPNNPQDNNVKGGSEDMNIAQLKKEDPEGFAAFAKDVRMEIQGDVQKQYDGVVTTLKTEVASKDTQIESQNKRIAALEKDNAIRAEESIREKADRIWTEELAASDIPARLQPKARTQVSYSGFVSKEGVFDADAFTAAVRKEITTWPEAKVLGSGATVRDVVQEDGEAKTEKEDEALAASIFGLTAQGKAQATK